MQAGGRRFDPDHLHHGGVEVGGIFDRQQLGLKAVTQRSPNFGVIGRRSPGGGWGLVVPLGAQVGCRDLCQGESGSGASLDAASGRKSDRQVRFGAVWH